MNSKGEKQYSFLEKGIFLNCVLLTYDSHSIKYPTMQMPVGFSVLRGFHDPHRHWASVYNFITKGKHTVLSGHPRCLLPSSCGQPGRFSFVWFHPLWRAYIDRVLKPAALTVSKVVCKGERWRLLCLFVCFNYKKQKQRNIALLRYP